MLLDKLVQLFISYFLFLHFVLNIVIVLDDFLALLPEFLHQLIDKLSFSLELKFLFSTFLMLLHQFFLKLFLACSNKLLTQISFILTLSRKVICHPLHFLQEERPVRLLLQSNFLSLDFSTNTVS